MRTSVATGLITVTIVREFPDEGILGREYRCYCDPACSGYMVNMQCRYFGGLRWDNSDSGRKHIPAEACAESINGFTSFMEASDSLNRVNIKRV
jgi:hypothetical protein